MKTAKKRRGGSFAMALTAAGLMVFLSAAPALAVETLSTGAGRDERAISHRGYSLKVVFAERQGPYVAGVSVQIIAEGGQALVDELSVGPWFYADLPPGAYEVRAQRGGARTKGAVEVSGGRQKTLYLTFRASG